jgi:hypothetical protein
MPAGRCVDRYTREAVTPGEGGGGSGCWFGIGGVREGEDGEEDEHPTILAGC